MKVVKEITVEVDHCYHQCPHYSVEGNGNEMVCTHPKAPYGGHIISHPECDKGFPKLCPLINHYK